MERKIEEFYRKWKNDIIRKPLILYGAKQIGKTFSVLEFGKKDALKLGAINVDGAWYGVRPVITISKDLVERQ